MSKLEEWKQAARVEANLRREFLERAEKAEAEIERLSEQLVECEARYVAHVRAADAEIKRLREALMAERERCARIVEGVVVHDHYRTWPGLLGGNHGNRSELTVLADAFAAAIRRGPDEQQAPEALDDLVARITPENRHPES